jgi:hypothetical protein
MILASSLALAADLEVHDRGDALYTAAFLGADGTNRVGVSGIAAMFVFDAEHQLVAQLSGWGPGSTELDDAIERMLAATERR